MLLKSYIKGICLVFLGISLTGCAGMSIKETSDHGVVVVSTSFVDGCNESSYFKNGTLYAVEAGKNSKGFNIPIGHVGGGTPFLVKNVLMSTDFEQGGKVHSKKFPPGAYYFSKINSTPMSFVHHSTDPLNIFFDVKPGKIHYLGSLEFGVLECAKSIKKPNVGEKTIVRITDESDRDFKVMTTKWKNRPMDLVDKTIVKMK